MKLDIFERAKARLERAWSEAEYKYGRREPWENAVLLNNGREFLRAGQEVNGVFGGLNDNPCADCGRCCTQAAFSSGFHTHTEREVILAEDDFDEGRGIGTPLDYIVKSWGYEPEPPERCLFLKPDGCNLPTRLQSSTCTTYVCFDKLGPALAKQNLESEYKKTRGVHSRALRVIQDSLSDLDYETEVSSLGSG